MIMHNFIKRLVCGIINYIGFIRDVNETKKRDGVEMGSGSKIRIKKAEIKNEEIIEAAA